MFLEATQTLTVTTSGSCREQVGGNLIVLCFVKHVCMCHTNLLCNLMYVCHVNRCRRDMLMSETICLVYKKLVLLY